MKKKHRTEETVTGISNTEVAGETAGSQPPVANTKQPEITGETNASQSTVSDTDKSPEVVSEAVEELKIQNSSTENNTTPKEVEKTKRPRRKHVIGWIALATILLMALAYAGIGVYYQSRFLPNTYINGMDCSNLEAAAVVSMLENQAQSYQLEVTGRNPGKAEEKQVLGTLSAPEIHLSLVGASEAVQQLLDRQDSFLWITRLGNQVDSVTLTQGVAFDEEVLETIVSAWDAFLKNVTIAPENAYISDYSEKTKSYSIVPDTPGTRIDKKNAITAIIGEIYLHSPQIDLEEYNCYQSAKITADNKKLLKEIEKANQWVAARITYDWNGTEVILDGDRIHQWITFQNDKPVLDEEAVREFVVENAKENDTYGKKRNFKTALGVELTLPGGAYGWKTDRDGETEALCELIYTGEEAEREPIYTSKGAKKGKEDIGSTYIEIDLTNQHLYLYERGEVILETDLVSGSMNVPRNVTPQGVFGLTYKTRNAVLRGEDYETPVSYWMPFNGNVGMHDATWRSSFGGTIYLTNGSHGCINLPYKMAAKIYDYVSTAFPIICYYY